MSDLHRKDQKPLGVRDMVLAQESIEIKETAKERKVVKRRRRGRRTLGAAENIVRKGRRYASINAKALYVISLNNLEGEAIWCLFGPYIVNSSHFFSVHRNGRGYHSDDACITAI